MSLKQWWTLVKNAASAWVDDFAPSMGAALSYYTVFSLAPMFLIVIAVAGLVFGEDAARGALFEELNGLMGADAAKAVEGMLASVSKPSQGVMATVIGVVVLLIGATTVFGELQDALDRIWRVPAKDKPGGLWGMLRTRFSYEGKSRRGSSTRRWQGCRPVRVEICDPLADPSNDAPSGESLDETPRAKGPPICSVSRPGADAQ